MIRSAQKITYDTDEGRLNSSPALVVGTNGRRIIFYQKTFYSGRVSYSPSTSHVTFSGLTINVPAGTGLLNGSGVSWSAAVLTATINTFQLLYVDSGGTVNLTTSFSMTTISTSVVLAYVFVGGSAITSLEEVEINGKYIYVRKQELSGGSWFWGNNEYVLMTGEEPKASYDVAANKVYLSYKKDSISYIRMFDLSTELTWQYIPNITIPLPYTTINLNNNPQNSVVFSTSSGYEATIGNFVTPKLYTLNYTALKFIEVGGVLRPHIYMPFVSSSPGFLAYLKFPYYVEIFSYNGISYTREDSIAVYDNSKVDIINDIPLRWHQWTGTLGQKYLGIRAYNTLFVDPYVSLPEDYLSIYVWYYLVSGFEGDQTVGNTIYSYVVQDVFNIRAVASGYEGLISKTSEFDFLRDTELSVSTIKSAGGSEGTITSIDFESVASFADQSSVIQFSGAYEGIIRIV